MSFSSPTNAGLRLLVQPLVRFCLRHSTKTQEVYSILKSEFVREAQRILVCRGERATVSRLSVITGIPRKLIPAAAEPLAKPAIGANLVLSVVERWRTHPAYCSKKNRPKPLSCEGSESEFAQLVRSVSGDLNPYTVLFELERVHLVAREEGTVRLAGSLFLEKDLARALEMAANEIDALIRVIEHNVQQRGDEGGKEHLHLTTTFDNIPDEHLEEVREWVLKEGSAFQRRVREHLAKFDRDSGLKHSRTKGRNTVRVVTFEFSTKTNEA